MNDFYGWVFSEAPPLLAAAVLLMTLVAIFLIVFLYLVVSFELMKTGWEILGAAILVFPWLLVFFIAINMYRLS